jgi:prepilin-type N-terminal cleavage/methylation domain-containing protein
MRRVSFQGFTLIELLTVIAIIAVLAAILFPVFSRARESARQASCIKNMHDLYVAASAYRLDNEQYPCLLLGFAERPDGMPWLQGDPGPVPASSIKHGYLYPAYIKSIDTFHCPDNPDRSLTTPTKACYPPSSPWNQYLMATYGKDESRLPLCRTDLPPSYDGQPVPYYAYDSYDISSALMMDGKRMPAPGAPNGGFYIHYSRDWTGNIVRKIDPRLDPPNQCKYPRTMPTEKTVLTWCNYHVTTAGADRCPVVFVSGRAKTITFKHMVESGWNIANTAYSN